MYPTKLPGLLARFADHPDHLPVQSELIHSAWICIRREQHLIRPRRYANRPGSAVLRCCSFGRRHITLCRTRSRIERNINGHRSNECSVWIKDLNSTVPSIRYVDISFRIRSDAVGRVEFAGFVPAIAPLLNPGAVLVELCNARVDVSVADENIAF